MSLSEFPSSILNIFASNKSSKFDQIYTKQFTWTEKNLGFLKPIKWMQFQTKNLVILMSSKLDISFFGVFS